MIEDPAVQQSLVNILHAALGAGGGGGIILYIGKFLFQQIVKSFEDYASKINEALIKLSAINVKLELLDQHNRAITKLQDIVQSHETKIAMLEAKIALLGKYEQK